MVLLHGHSTLSVTGSGGGVTGGGSGGAALVIVTFIVITMNSPDRLAGKHSHHAPWRARVTNGPDGSTDGRRGSWAQPALRHMEL